MVVDVEAGRFLGAKLAEDGASRPRLQRLTRWSSYGHENRSQAT